MKRHTKKLSSIQQMLKRKRQIALKKPRKEAARPKLALIVDNGLREAAI